MPVRRRVAVAALAPLLLLAGCQDDPESLMPSDTVTSSPTATDTPSEVGTEAKETPEEFLRRWQAAALHAQRSGDVDVYRALGPQCEPCNAFADQVERIYADGGRIELGDLEVLRVSPVPGSDVEFLLRRRVGPTRVLDSRGDEVQALDGGTESLRVFVKSRGVLRTVTHFVRLPN